MIEPVLENICSKNNYEIRREFLREVYGALYLQEEEGCVIFEMKNS